MKKAQLLLAICLLTSYTLLAQPAVMPASGFKWVKTSSTSWSSGPKFTAPDGDTSFGQLPGEDGSQFIQHQLFDVLGDPRHDPPEENFPNTTSETRTLTLNDWNNTMPEANVGNGANNGIVHLQTSALLKILPAPNLGESGTGAGMSTLRLQVIGGTSNAMTDFKITGSYDLSWVENTRFNIAGTSGNQQTTQNSLVVNDAGDMMNYNWSETDCNCNPATWLFEGAIPQGGFGETFSEDFNVTSQEDGGQFEITFTCNASIILERNSGNADGRAQAKPGMQGMAQLMVNYDVWEIQPITDTDGDGFDPTVDPGDPIFDPDDNNNCSPNPNLGDCDQDNDGLTNDEETAAGTNAMVADSDNDGVNDGDEVNGLDGNPNTGDETNPNVQDTDGDGVLDDDEVFGIDGNPNTGDESDPNDPCSPNLMAGPCDQDNDGLTNDEETNAGTNATVADSDNDGLTDGEEVNGLDGIPNSGDETNPNLQDTDNDGVLDDDEVFGLDGNPNTGDETNPNLQDSDNDGLNDNVEVFGLDGNPDTGDETNPNAQDTDGDGTLDDDEVLGIDGNPSTGDESDPNNPCDPNPSSIACDGDGDGLSNDEEDMAGTNPAIPDTDNDGVNDGDEVNGLDGIPNSGDETNPLVMDTDNDGVLDDDEVFGLDGNPNTGDETNPNSQDTDGDGTLDDDEVFGPDLTPNTGDETDANNPCDPDNTVGVCDQDMDGLTNAEEVIAGTNETENDTDNDGVLDGDEVFGIDGVPNSGDETNPNVQDTDGDDVNDNAEVFGPDLMPNTGDESDPNDPCSPNLSAGLCDQDNDGLTNNQEAMVGTDETVADSDNDGLTDGEEVNGLDGNPGTDDETNPNEEDTDGDGINDNVEVNGPDGIPGNVDDTDPNDPCSPNLSAGPCDQDNDNLTNEEEAMAGTDATMADSDNDGLNDDVEVNGLDGTPNSGDETNPNSQDTDGDGVMDEDEVLGVDDTADTGDESDPNNPCSPNLSAGLCDQDMDGLNNNQEMDAGTDPTIGDSDEDGVNDGAEVNGQDGTPDTGDESNPNDPCSPNPNSAACLSLSVEWVSFSAQLKEAEVLLNWTTANEENNIGFDIERSSNNRYWENIGFIKSEEMPSSFNQYEFVDESPLNGKNYYRLRQIDANSETSYSTIEVVVVEKQYEVTLFPNPVADVLNINLGNNAAVTEIKIFNTNGQIVERMDIGVDASFINLPLSHLPSGLYWIRLEDNSNSILSGYSFVKE